MNMVEDSRLGRKAVKRAVETLCKKREHGRASIGYGNYQLIDIRLQTFSEDAWRNIDEKEIE